MSADRRSALQFLYEDVQIIVIDEVSMLGTNKLAAINYRCVIVITFQSQNERMQKMDLAN